MLHRFATLSLFTILGTATLVCATPSAERLNVVNLAIEGYSALKDHRSYLDVGVLPVFENGTLSKCELLPPRKSSKAASQPWFPFDFYNNVLDSSTQNTQDKSNRLGEPDIFFEGDDNNRNGREDSHRWTCHVHDAFKGSLSFSEKVIEPDQFTFQLAFKRGVVAYEALFRTRAFVRDGKCAAATDHCTQIEDKDGKKTCAPNGWSRQLLQVVAQANLKGALSDTLLGVTDEKAKSDVAALFAIFQNIGPSGEPLGQPYREKQAPL